MMKAMLAVMIGASAVAFAPQPVAASDCTDGYVKCLNDTHDLSGWLQTLADIECAAEYTGCVSQKVIKS